MTDQFVTPTLKYPAARGEIVQKLDELSKLRQTFSAITCIGILLLDAR